MSAKLPNPIDYANSTRYLERNPWTWRRTVVLIVAVCFAISAAAALLLPSLGRPRAAAQVVKCASNLHQLGQALSIYANSNAGAYPDRLEEVFGVCDITPGVFVCPNSTTEQPAAEGATPQQTIANMYRESGHCSYVYVGAGLLSSCPPETVLAYEPLGHHPPDSKGAIAHHVDGANVLFADGSAAFVDAPEMTRLLAELALGRNPPNNAAALRKNAR